MLNHAAIIRYIERCFQLDKKAQRILFETFYKEYRSLYSYVYSILGVHNDVDDVLNTVLFDLCNNPDALAKSSNPKGLLFISVRNAAINFKKKSSRIIYTSDSPSAYLSSSDYTMKEIELFETISCIREYMNELAPELHDPFIEHLLYGRTIRDIAEKTGISYWKVYYSFNKLKAKMRKALLESEY